MVLRKHSTCIRVHSLMESNSKFEGLKASGQTQQDFQSDSTTIYSSTLYEVFKRSVNLQNSSIIITVLEHKSIAYYEHTILSSLVTLYSCIDVQRHKVHTDG